jgi:hypothetical protein
MREPERNEVFVRTAVVLLAASVFEGGREAAREGGRSLATSLAGAFLDLVKHAALLDGPPIYRLVGVELVGAGILVALVLSTPRNRYRDGLLGYAFATGLYYFSVSHELVRSASGAQVLGHLQSASLASTPQIAYVAMSAILLRLASRPEEARTVDRIAMGLGILGLFALTVPGSAIVDALVSAAGCAVALTLGVRSWRHEPSTACLLFVAYGVALAFRPLVLSSASLVCFEAYLFVMVAKFPFLMALARRPPARPFDADPPDGMNAGESPVSARLVEACTV